MTVIHSAQLVSGGETTHDAWVRFEGGRVAATGVGSSWRECTSPADEIVDAAGRILAPGFIDLHCHGGGGASFDGGSGAIRTALAAHRAHGTTRSVLSLVTAAVTDLSRQLDTIATIAETDPLVLGAHLEGPFLDVAHKGAHDAALLRDPARHDVDALVDAARGRLVQITLAPERPGALDAIDRLVAAGVRVAVGHTAADYAQTRDAFDRGASILTHAFNAMDGIHHRAPGPVGAALRAGGVTLELIDDGVHVHSAVARMAFDAAPGRVALVSDAMGAAAAPDGDYVLGSLAVTVAGGVARLAGDGAIAGSTLTLDHALRRAVVDDGVPLAAAVDALTRVPARAIGRGGDLGVLEAGYAADAVLLTHAYEVVGVWGAGEPLASHARG
ncbi:N-acetylglucosamine-6-phosphate deacetylase [Microbacterium sp. G2-8]|uniref:N-acetylglucosamine-6-phosphate deacetylase n=1 Tax=Microbacterium sp. G2-8 TaxID=2842454 RepID=UPI001C898FEE|nr:N-acetylglucosamine-6-phosphate deacetylase [Microbacterium sp. G2-8]